MTDNRTTELLRKLLDERGVKYSDFTSATRNGKAIFKTRWKHERGYAELSEWESTGSNNLFIQNVDPEQVIAATLGSEPCVIESTRYIESDIPDSWYEFDLSCGHTVKSEQVPPNYCEECGKRIDLQGVSYV